MGDATDFLNEDEAEEQDRSYEDRARQEMLGLIDREHAVVWHEIEARLSETPRSGGKGGINPHHLTNVRSQLISNGLIEAVAGTTRGGREIIVYGLGNRHRREVAFDRAARRKRLLETRYLSWASGGTAETNAIGTAGELVTHQSLTEAATLNTGYRLLSPDGRQVSSLFGKRITGGPIDNATLLIGADVTNPTVITVMIEVKNLRPWLYPTASEIYQLLHKAAMAQIENPNHLIMPVLVARQVHYLTRAMAKHLGFFTITFDEATQPIRNLEAIEPHFVEEVCQELGYDLRLVPVTGESFTAVCRAFQYTVPKQAYGVATKWAQMGPSLVNHFAKLRNSGLTGDSREMAVDNLYRSAAQIAPPSPRWRSAPRRKPTQAPW